MTSFGTKRPRTAAEILTSHLWAQVIVARQCDAGVVRIWTAGRQCWIAIEVVEELTGAVALAVSLARKMWIIFAVERRRYDANNELEDQQHCPLHQAGMREVQGHGHAGS